MKTKIILLMLLILSGETKGWDTTAAKFYPLNIGDVHVYQYSLLSPFNCTPVSTGRDKVIIVGDTILSTGKKYFIFRSGDGSYRSFERIDSSSMNVYSYQNGEDVLLDSLLGNNKDRFNGRRIPIATTQAVIHNSFRFIFNQNRNAKLIFDGLVISRYKYYLVDGFGLTNVDYCTEGPMQGYSSELRGCIIRGIVYGDTTFTSIKKISYNIPEKFVLYQNYPNPFNPKTIIIYSIPTTQYTILKVFDALGKEVITLVNEKQSASGGAGTYSVEFDGSNLPSGIYFYKLETESASGGFSETKRMILLK